MITADERSSVDHLGAEIDAVNRIQAALAGLTVESRARVIQHVMGGAEGSARPDAPRTRARGGSRADTASHRQRCIEMLATGAKMRAVAAEVGVRYGAVRLYAHQAVKEGRLRRIGVGQFAAPFAVAGGAA